MTLAVEELTRLRAEGTVDTVVVAFTDMQGRLQGKRCHADVLPRRGARRTAPRPATTCSPSTST